MEIKINSDELTALKNDLADLRQENKRLRIQIEQLGENEMKAQAAKLAEDLLDSYLRCIFTKLGFTQSGIGTIRYKRNLYESIGQNCLEREDVEVTLSAVMTKKWKEAFLEIGVIVPKDQRIKQ